MADRKESHVSSSVGSYLLLLLLHFQMLSGFNTLGNHGDKLLPSLADEGTEAQRGEVTCLLAGQ